MSTRFLATSLPVLALILALPAWTQPPPNIVPNGDLDGDLTGWNQIDPASQGLTGTLTLTYDPADDAVGNPGSGSMVIDWDLTDPTGTTLEATLVSSDCLPGLVPGEINRGAWTHYVDAPLTDGAVITFRSFDGTACLPGPPNGLERFLLTEASDWFGSVGPLFNVGPLQESLRIEFDALFVPGGGGTTVSSGTLHLDRISVFEEALFTPLDAFAEVVSTNGLTVELLANWSNGSSPYPPGVSWDFGDGTTGTGETVVHTFPAAGSYTVLMTLNNGFRTIESTAFVTVAHEPSEVPTLSGVGLVVMVGLLAWLAFRVLRQRRAVS